MKIQKMVSLDAETARLASMKTNFSDWVRNRLRSERNKLEIHDFSSRMIDQQKQMEERLDISTSELLYHLEQKSDEEIKILVQLLKNA
tara:strand:+ start:90 stop:353 length:264 start_codon:yes stop_codon:yes gene_type:complete